MSGAVIIYTCCACDLHITSRLLVTLHFYSSTNSSYAQLGRLCAARHGGSNRSPQISSRHSAHQLSLTTSSIYSFHHRGSSIYPSSSNSQSPQISSRHSAHQLSLTTSRIYSFHYRGSSIQYLLLSSNSQSPQISSRHSAHQLSLTTSSIYSFIHRGFSVSPSLQQQSVTTNIVSPLCPPIIANDEQHL
ncbi:hypothetical protein J6590_038823 [Homalodisca vitripennis]|nr:hypothetical protein J6590_038823 [Homalodisca vitripennis]